MRCFIGIDLGSTTTKAVLMDESQNVLGPRHHQFALELRHGDAGREAGGAHQRAASPVPPARSRQLARLDGALDALPRRAGAQLPPGAVPRAARRSRATCLAQRRRRALQGSDERGAGGARRRVRPIARRGAGALRPRRQARSRISSATSPDRHTWRPAQETAKRAGHPYDLLLHVYDRRSSRSRTGADGEIDRQVPLAALDRVVSTLAGIRRRQSRSRRRSSAPRARHRRSRRPIVVGTGYGRATLAVLQGAHPLGDPVPRARRARHVSRARARCSTSAARTPRRSRSTPPASSRASR